MAMDSSHMMSTVSLIGSAASAAATAYFWAVRVRRERPSLKLYSADRATEINLGVYRGETRGLQFRTGVIVANYSSLPNAVLAAEIALKKRDGSWEEVPSARATGLPLNVPSMTTVRLEVEWSVTLPSLASAEELRGSDVIRSYLDHYYAESRRFGVSIWALGNREFRAVLPLTMERPAIRLSEAA
jgi:hypothetical protein